jgi:hypothetical protein
MQMPCQYLSRNHNPAQTPQPQQFTSTKPKTQTPAKLIKTPTKSAIMAETLSTPTHPTGPNGCRASKTFKIKPA